MRQYLKVLVVAFLVWLPHQACCQNTPKTVRQIEITSSIEPRVPSRSRRTEMGTTELRIEKQGDAYQLDGKAVDPGLIANLLQALSAPPDPNPTLDALGITSDWLKEHASSVSQTLSESLFIGGSRIHADKLEAAFSDPARIAKILPTLFDSRHYSCADCTRYRRHAKIIVTFADGSALGAQAGSEFPFLLPWNVWEEHVGITYSANISRALVALMPPDARNRSLLAGEYVGLQLGRELAMQVEHEQRLLEVEAKTGETFATLRKKYAIESAQLNDDPDAAPGKQPGLNLRLRGLESPQASLTEDVILAFRDGKVIGLEKFLQDAPRYERLVLNVPWLQQYFQDLQESGAKRKVRPQPRLSYAEDASFTAADLQTFSEDMHAIGRDKVIPTAEADRERIALLLVGSGMEQSDWLVFPDGHALLWRARQIPVYHLPDLLIWSATAFPRKPCSSQANRFLGCVGTEVSPEGNLRASD